MNLLSARSVSLDSTYAEYILLFFCFFKSEEPFFGGRRGQDITEEVPIYFKTVVIHCFSKLPQEVGFKFF